MYNMNGDCEEGLLEVVFVLAILECKYQPAPQLLAPPGTPSAAGCTPSSLPTVTGQPDMPTQGTSWLGGSAGRGTSERQIIDYHRSETRCT
jgi:hypothetical protein